MDYENLWNERYNCVYTGIKLRTSHRNLQKFREPNILMSKEYMQMMTYTIFFQKNSWLKNSFDHQILNLQCSGLIQHWEKLFTRTIKDIEENEPKKLRVDQFIGIIEICSALYALSVLIFIMELMTLKYKKIKKIIDFRTFK